MKCPISLQTEASSKYVQEKFHNFEARGTWTEEQDEELQRAYAEHPGKWKLIGETLNRFPEDARDRMEELFGMRRHIEKGLLGWRRRGAIEGCCETMCGGGSSGFE